MFQQDAVDAATKLVFSYGVGATTGRWFGRSSLNKPLALAGDGSATPTVTGHSDMTSRHMARFRVTPTAVFASSDGGSENTLPVVPATASGPATIGASPSTTFFLNGKVSDILVTLPLSAGKAAQLQPCLMARRML